MKDCVVEKVNDFPEKRQLKRKKVKKEKEIKREKTTGLGMKYCLVKLCDFVNSVWIICQDL